MMKGMWPFAEVLPAHGAHTSECDGGDDMAAGTVAVLHALRHALHKV
jgi:hypothetical protein